jgi:amidase
MFEVMAASTWRDPSYVPAPFDGRHSKRAGWCLGAGCEPHAEVVEAVALARDALADHGWSVAEVEVPGLEAAARGWATLINTDFHMTNRETMLELGSSAIARMLETFDLVGPAVDLAGMYRLLAERASLLRQWQRLLTVDVDVVVMPVSMEPAWPAGDDTTSSERLEAIFAANTPLVAFNFLGLPSVAQPTSVVNGRPNGVQIVARRFAEHVTLDAAAAIESALGAFHPR